MHQAYLLLLCRMKLRSLDTRSPSPPYKYDILSSTDRRTTAVSECGEAQQDEDDWAVSAGTRSALTLPAYQTRRILAGQSHPP